jgi:hypothetical protein
MNKPAALFSASILLLGFLGAPSIAEDDVGADVDRLCQAAFNICFDTCNLKFRGPGFSSELAFDLCIDNCNSDMRSCTQTDDDVILRQNSRGKEALKKLLNGPIPTLSETDSGARN